MEQKTFCAILENFSSNPQKAKDAMSDKRLTQGEKNILQGLLLIRENKNLESIELLKVAKAGAPFVEAHRHLVLGMAYNNIRHSAEAMAHLDLAAEGFRLTKAPYFEFIAQMNLFMVSFILKDAAQMKQRLQQVKSYSTDRPKDILRILRCQFTYFSFISEFAKASEVLEEIELLKSSMTESDLIAHEVNKFMNHFNQDDLEACKKSLNDMKAFRKYHTTEIFNYFKILLGHLTENKPMYFNDKLFAHDPIIFHQMKLIQKFEECNLDACVSHWKNLQKINPEIYRDDFIYTGDKCLFSSCLDKHLSKLRKPSQVIQIKNSGRAIDRLQELFENLQTPISKEELYVLIWGKQIESKEDLVHLSQAIFRLKRKTGIEIKTRKGSYYVERNGRKVS